jgi:colicin import membrane protein
MKQLSKFSSRTLLTFAIAGSLLLSLHAVAQTSAVEAPADPADYSVAPLLERYPADSIQSPDAAKDALKEVDAAREHIDERYALEQRACYPKFFTTACLDKVTERRRKDLAAVRPIEVEANAYLRKAKVVERDRKLAEKAAENEADAAQRAQQSTQHDAAVTNKLEADQHDAISKESQRQKRADDAARKQADHAAREQERKANEARDAAGRAENVDKYNKKVKDAKQRQEEVAKKKAQRERERAAKAAKDAKQQEKAATPPP